MFSHTKIRCCGILLLCWFTSHHGQIVRITDVKCLRVDETFVRVTKCFTKVLSKTLSETTVNVTLVQEAEAVAVKIQFRKKSDYKYNPFFHSDLLIDACKFLNNRAVSPIGNYLFTLIEDFTNLNHSCPFKGYVVLDRFRVDMKRLKWLPVPSGEYLINYHWFLNGQKRFELEVYFTFNE